MEKVFVVIIYMPMDIVPLSPFLSKSNGILVDGLTAPAKK